MSSVDDICLVFFFCIFIFSSQIIICVIVCYIGLGIKFVLIFIPEEITSSGPH